MQHITKNKIKDIAKFINDNDFKYFVGYPSIVNSLAVILNDNDIHIDNYPKIYFTGAEKVYEDQRVNIRNAFPELRIVEHYSFSEECGAASQIKEDNQHYYEDFELGHLELADANERQTGVILATGFQNLGMPFIRYKVGDTATFSNDNNPFNNRQQIKDIEGRNEDYIITPEGAHIQRFDYLFKETYGIKECQVVQKQLGSIVIKIVKRENYTSQQENYIRKKLQELISPTLKVDFEYVESIPRTKAGKFKAVLNEMKSLNAGK